MESMEYYRKQRLFKSIPEGEMKDTDFQGKPFENKKYGVLPNGDVIEQIITDANNVYTNQGWDDAPDFYTEYKEYTGDEAKKYLAERLKSNE